MAIYLYFSLIIHRLVAVALIGTCSFLQPGDANTEAEMFMSSSQDSEGPGETSREWESTPRVKHKLHFLNNFLREASEGRVSPVRSQCTSNVFTTSSRTQRYYRRKAEQAIDTALDAIAPGNVPWLMQEVVEKYHHRLGAKGVVEGAKISRPLVLYAEANSWYTRQQILSIFASDYSKTELMELIPGLTKWRIDEDRKHAFQTKPGQPIDPPEIHWTRLDAVKVDHFLDFLASPSFLQDVPYDTRTLTLSSGEKIEIPNVVRTLIASRLVQLYLQFCQESGFEPMGRSTLFNILKVFTNIYCNV